MKQYLNKHLNEECIIFGTGPSIKYFNKSFCEGKILLGSNEMVYYDIPMDYYMIGDGGNQSRGYYSDPETYHNYQANIQKFCRKPPLNRKSSYNQLPDKLKGFRYFSVNAETFDSSNPFELNKINDVGTISIELAQFSLICGFSKIFLVGQDCNYKSGSFKSQVDTEIMKWGLTMPLKWKLFKNHVTKNYKSTQIISINPVALKGVFKDYIDINE